MKNAGLKEVLDGLDLQTDLWWLAMVLSGLVASFLAAFAFPESGTFWAYLSAGARLSLALCLAEQPWGGVFRRFLALGGAAGAFSIFADHLLVHWKAGGQRVYPEGEALVLSSPLFIPILWTCTVVEFGYAIVRLYGLAARRLSGEASLGTTMVAGGFLAAAWTVCTEFWAVKAGWWKYRPGYAILGEGCALYVVMAFFFIFFGFLPLFARYVSSPRRPLEAAIRYGALLGGLIFASFLAAHYLVERSF
ncbi:MAG TPA: hypothetical protein VNO22_00630 [Planctomycetota bacterium]|jgi:hypothetical protein|nr:hypothetical protein [Planctomycetota bacterium]